MIQLKKVASTIAMSGLVASLMATPVFADTNEISGNGHHSDNAIVSVEENTTVVEQTNVLTAITTVGVFQNTGGNSAKDNQGNVTINTGSAKSKVKTKVGGPSNEATVPDCGCADADENLISGNAHHSNNGVVDVDANAKLVGQTNVSFVLTGALVGQNTGDNEAKDNGGKVDIKTKKAKSKVETKVKASKNVLH